MTRWLGLAAAVTVAAVVFSINARVSAHPTVVSPYTFHRDVLPILEARCSRCHDEGSASGLPLLDYQNARGALWRITQKLVRGHMPPWFAEGRFQRPAPLTAAELNVLMTWTTGSAPEGKPTARETPETRTSWPLGRPDLIVATPLFQFTTDEGDQVKEVVLPAARIGGRTIRAVDLLPGTTALVRSAEIIARSGARDQVLGLWQPGEFPSPFSVNAGFQVPRSAQLVLRVRYRRLHGAPASDRSEVGLYFADRQASAIETVEMVATDARPHSQTIRRASRILAIRPIDGPSGATARIEIAGAAGARRELARIELRGGWDRRYVFETPAKLNAGDRLEVSVIASSSAFWSPLTNERTDPDAPVRIAIEFVR